MTTLSLTRSDLLSSSRFYDKHRDGADALPTGTPNTRDLPYTGTITDIRLDDSLALARATYLVRTTPAEFNAVLVEHVLNTREARTPDHMWDWDCRYCQLAVMTDAGDTACPHCLLT